MQPKTFRRDLTVCDTVELIHVAPVELIEIDPDRVVELAVTWGKTGVEGFVERTLDHLRSRADGLMESLPRGKFTQMSSVAGEVEVLAATIGLQSVVRISMDLQACFAKKRAVESAAVLGRLHRQVHGVSPSAWDVQDLSC